MSVHLCPEDCRAIDLLLDQGMKATGSRAITSSASSVAQDRLAAVQQVLVLLDLMPALQPPADLISKTLALIEASPRSAGSAATMPGSLAFPDQPPA